MFRSLLPWLCALTLVFGAVPAQAAKLGGTALIRERIALPPDAALFAFDATCRACGWHFTSPARRAALLAADAETPSHAELARSTSSPFTTVTRPTCATARSRICTPIT